MEPRSQVAKKAPDAKRDKIMGNVRGRSGAQVIRIAGGARHSHEEDPEVLKTKRIARQLAAIFTGTPLYLLFFVKSWPGHAASSSTAQAEAGIFEQPSKLSASRSSEVRSDS